jgi:hypothetical protein
MIYCLEDVKQRNTIVHFGNKVTIVDIHESTSWYSVDCRVINELNRICNQQNHYCINWLIKSSELQLKSYVQNYSQMNSNKSVCDWLSLGLNAYVIICINRRWWISGTTTSICVKLLIDMIQINKISWVIIWWIKTWISDGQNLLLSHQSWRTKGRENNTLDNSLFESDFNMLVWYNLTKHFHVCKTHCTLTWKWGRIILSSFVQCFERHKIIQCFQFFSKTILFVGLQSSSYLSLIIHKLWEQFITSLT